MAVAVIGSDARAVASDPGAPSGSRAGAAGVFAALMLVSFVHSCVYLGLLVCAFLAGKPQPATFTLGLTHGVLWICMSAACLAATRRRILHWRLAVAVAVLGGIGPFFGSYEFVRERRRRRAASTAL